MEYANLKRPLTTEEVTLLRFDGLPFPMVPQRAWLTVPVRQQILKWIKEDVRYRKAVARARAARANRDMAVETLVTPLRGKVKAVIKAASAILSELRYVEEQLDRFDEKIAKAATEVGQRRGYLEAKFKRDFFDVYLKERMRKWKGNHTGPLTIPRLKGRGGRKYFRAPIAADGGPLEEPATETKIQ